jgi:hypothetical protein
MGRRIRRERSGGGGVESIAPKDSPQRIDRLSSFPFSLSSLYPMAPTSYETILIPEFLSLKDLRIMVGRHYIHPLYYIRH